MSESDFKAIVEYIRLLKKWQEELDEESEFPQMEMDLCSHEPSQTTARRRSWVYLFQCERTKLLKIGFSRDPEARRRGIEGAGASPIRMLSKRSGGQRLERFLHHRFRAYRVQREWFQPDPEILAHFKVRA